MLALVRFAFLSTLLIAPNLSLADEKGTAATAITAGLAGPIGAISGPGTPANDQTLAGASLETPPPSSSLIPTRGLADSLGLPKSSRGQNRWWRRGDSPCDRGLHFARTMTPLACAGWLGGRRALPRGVASWQWPRSMTAARAQRQPASAGSVCRRSGTGC